MRHRERIVNKRVLLSKGLLSSELLYIEAHKTNPCTEIHLLSSELPSNGSDFAFLEHIEMDV
jgi:hypothetical protein